MRNRVALLRGINVGGHRKLSMADLRAIAVDLGFDDPATHGQSGNLVFGSDDDDVAERLHAGIDAETGLDVAVVTRARDDWAAAMAACPYRELAGQNPKQVHVTFFAGWAEAALDGMALDAWPPDEATVSGREVHLSLPNGMARSRLAEAVERAAKRHTGSTRNWNTVEAIARLLDLPT